MRQYNIYAGLKGGIIKTKYQFTGLYETEDEALKDAYDVDCDIYGEFEGNYGLCDWEDIVILYCDRNNLSQEDLKEEDLQTIENYYYKERDNWLAYYVIPTDEDNIDTEDLIIGYIIEDDSAS